VPTLPTSSLPQTDLELEIAHLLLIDIVGYSKLLVNEQIETVQELGRIVRSTECFRKAEAAGRLIRVPTGDGMALLFFQSPEEPVRCALEISHQLKENSEIRLRMGIHSGPVNQVRDVNDTINVAGTGINVAQRVMDCGDAGHILLSKHIADDLAQYRHWQPYLHDFGECEVKHGMRLHIVNLCKDGVGNPALPEKFRRGKRWKQSVAVRPIGPLRVPKSPLIVALVLSVLALAVSSVVYLRWTTPVSSISPSNAVAEKSIAVLPFENLSDDKQNAYFTDGVQDEILNGLSKVADLKVISRTSVMPYRTAGGRNLREIAKTLGVAHIVEGTVQRSGNRVRVSAQLINARNDVHLWGEHYDRDLADVFTLESELAEKIVAQLKATLSPEEKAAIEEPPTKDLVAYDLFTRAKNLIDGISLRPQGKDDLLEAVALLDRAITRDPAFLRAHCALARAHDALYFIGFDHTPARLELAQKAVDEALKLRPDSGEAHLALAQHLFSGYRDYERARAELAIAQRQLPNDALLLRLAGIIDRRQGRWDQAINEMKHAADLDPRNTSLLEQLCFLYESMRDFEKAQGVVNHILSIAPNNMNAQITRAYIDFEWYGNSAPLHQTIQSILSKNRDAAPTISAVWMNLALTERDSTAAEQALSHLPKGGCDYSYVPFPDSWCEGLVARLRGDRSAAQKAFLQARTEIQEILRQQPDYAEALCVLGLVDAALGKNTEAIKEGRRAVELCPLTKDAVEGALLIDYLAVIYTWTGEKDLALQQLEVAARIPNGWTYGDLRADPYWDSLRGDKRFEKITASLAPKKKTN
jgi:TolB-like protein/class 3 adenylate cyclase/Tfp pilus assembly protein PilF